MVEALQGDADWAVTFRPFSLQQNHNQPEETDVWDVALDSDQGSGVRALLWSLGIRDEFPDEFLGFHTAMFAARHDEALDISDESVISDVATSVGLDAPTLAGLVASGIPQKQLKTEHLSLLEDHEVFGVPTFIIGDEAVFVRVMDRHNIPDIERVVDMIGWTNVNEFKRTSIAQ
ncbi:MAG: DsbA family protein [Actinomycetia bacterium]|nr:DsbA family protein [Actinomycetes bacterium]